MALNRLVVYESSNMSQDKSLLGISNGFNITLCHNAFWTYNSDFWRLTKNEGFQGIMLEDLSLSFQTPWSNAGGAVLGDKIESFLNSSIVKFLAGQSDHGFSPFICSDAWTQQKVNGDAQPIKVQLKFRAYNDNRIGCTNYNDVLRFLIHICSPLKSSNKKNNPNELDVGNYFGNTLNDVVAGGANLFGKGVDAIGDIGGSLFDNGKKVLSNVPKLFNEESRAEAQNAIGYFAKDVVQTADKVYDGLLKETANGKNNGNFTVEFKLGNKINKCEVAESEKYLIDWIISSFSFKPSRQFEMVSENKKKYPKPLWMDFDLSLETRLSLSNKYVYKTLIESPLMEQALK